MTSFFFFFFFFFKSRLLLTLAAAGCFVLIIIFILFLIVRCGHGSNQSATTKSDSELISRMETKLLARVTTRGPSRELHQTLRTVYFILSSYSARTDLRSKRRLFIRFIDRSNERKSHKAVHDWIEATRPVISTNVSVIHTRPNQVKTIFEEHYGAIHIKIENASCLYGEARFHLSLPSFKSLFGSPVEVVLSCREFMTPVFLTFKTTLQ